SRVLRVDGGLALAVEHVEELEVELEAHVADLARVGEVHVDAGLEGGPAVVAARQDVRLLVAVDDVVAERRDGRARLRAEARAGGDLTLILEIELVVAVELEGVRAIEGQLAVAVGQKL